MKRNVHFTTLLPLCTALGAAPLASAATSHNHDPGSHHPQGTETRAAPLHPGHNDKMAGMFLKKKVIDGYTVTFHVMKAQPGKAMGGSHDFMLKVEREGVTQQGIAMNTKVIYPDGTSESKMTMPMGDWLMAGYDLGQEGKHQLLILFKTPDGSKHKGGVYYP